MALFIKKNKEEIIFDKEFIIKEILQEAPEKVSAWKIIDSNSLECDLLCIKSTNINKEITIEDNPFSNYRRVVPVTYQIVVPVYVIEGVRECLYVSYGWRAMCIDSAELLFRKLDQEE